ncbi:hypothetical protein CG427_19635, partial [Pantoea ananatis]
MRHPWRSRPRRGFRAAPSWPLFFPQRGGCLLKTPACEGLFLIGFGSACEAVSIPLCSEQVPPARHRGVSACP